MRLYWRIGIVTALRSTSLGFLMAIRESMTIRHAPPGIGLEQLTATRCRWPVAGETLGYCGATKPELIRPYCEAH